LQARAPSCSRGPLLVFAAIGILALVATTGILLRARDDTLSARAAWG